MPAKGDIVAGYRIEEVLGPEEYAATGPDGHKVVLRIVEGGPEAAARFGLLKASPHPNVVPVLDTGVWEGSAFVVTEPVPGVSPAAIEASGMAGALLDAVAAALEHLRSLGLTHRELVDGDVVVNSSGHAVLTGLRLVAEGEPAPVDPLAGLRRQVFGGALAAAARAGVVPAAPDEGSRGMEHHRTERPTIPPARLERPAPPTEAAGPRSASGWWRAVRGLLLAAAAGGIGYLILDRLLGSIHDLELELDAGDDVECTVFAPPAAAPGDTILVQAFVHVPAQGLEASLIALEMDDAARRRVYRSLALPVPRGARLDFELVMPGLDLDAPHAELTWNGRTEAVQFGVTIPAGTRPGAVVGTLDVSREGLPLGNVKFKLAIEQTAAPAAPAEPQGEAARRYTAAFVSYASKDRAQVLELVRMLPLVGITYFQDVLSLEPGDRWERRLECGIDECDLFLLFWSSEAKRSEWVRREVRHALDRRAGDDLAPPEIKPVVIEGPPVIEPWEEVAHLHFDDRHRYFIRGLG